MPEQPSQNQPLPNSSTDQSNPVPFVLGGALGLIAGLLLGPKGKRGKLLLFGFGGVVIGTGIGFGISYLFMNNAEEQPAVTTQTTDPSQEIPLEGDKARVLERMVMFTDLGMVPELEMRRTIAALPEEKITPLVQYLDMYNENEPAMSGTPEGQRKKYAMKVFQFPGDVYDQAQQTITEMKTQLNLPL